MPNSPDIELVHRSRHDGFALIVVLIALALITALTVFFMSDVGRERRGIDQYSRGSEVRHLTDTAINLVQAQINAATKENTNSNPTSWASQPGMIRTYGTDGKLSKAYKLYSWENFVESGADFDPVTNPAELPASNWARLPAQYTDLNVPVNGTYPIVDPSIANAVNDPLTDNNAVGTPLVTGSPSNTVPSWDFPQACSVITNPTKGYYASTANALPMPVKWLYILQDGTWLAAPSSANTSSVTFTSGGSATSPVPSASNPIIGRVAFWTDDETSKVNINTASEGSYWDSPKAATSDEMQFAANPPTKGEFQRLSGHPATTSVSAIFPEMRQGTYNRWTNVGSPGTPNSYLGQLKGIYDMIPRIDWGLDSSNNLQGGSQGGTYPITSYVATYAPSSTTYPWVDPNRYSITTDTNRLYASADDLLFQSTRTKNLAFTNYSITGPQLAKRLFLFTANSRAPETTLFDTPRVSLWPVTWPNTLNASPSVSISSFYVTGGSGAGTRASMPPYLDPNTKSLSDLFANKGITPQEMLLAFCSTLDTDATGKGSPYYFQRQNPDSPTWDYSTDVTSARIKRNYEVVNYLRREVGKGMPGMVNDDKVNPRNTLETKWGATNADWITLNCFDYSRSLINQYTFDPNPTASQLTSSAANYGLQYSYTGMQDAQRKEINAFTVAPLRTALKANGPVYVTEGAYPALKEVAVTFIAANRNIPTLKTTVAKPFVYKDVSDPEKWDNLISYDPTTGFGNSQTTAIQAVMMFSFAQMNPGVFSYKGLSGYTPSFWIKVTPVGSTNTSFTVNGTNIHLPKANGPGGSNSVLFNTLQGFSGNLPTAIAPFFRKTYNYRNQATSVKNFANTANNATTWSLTSDVVTIANSPNQLGFSLSGPKLQVDIYAPDPSGDLYVNPTANPNCLVSSQLVDFSQWDSGPRSNPIGVPSGKFPIPIAPRWNVRQAAMTYTTTSPPNPVPDKITGGVLMPQYSLASVNNPGWQTEIVPAIATAAQVVPNLSGDPRNGSVTLATGTASSPSAATDAAGGLNEPMMYVYKDSVGRSSTKFEDRVMDTLADGASATHASSPLCYFGETISAEYPASSYATTPTEGVSYNVYGGGQAVQTTQAYQVITPYDTVISMVSDPRVLPTSATAGDARLMGRGLYSAAGNTSFIRIDDAMASTGYTPTTVFSYADPVGNGKVISRPTAKMQFHALGSPSTIPMVTGYRPDFKFGSNLFAQRGSQNQRTTGPAGYLLGRDANDSGIGVEGNITMSLNPNGDWTALPGNSMDGGYLARPDQEYQSIYPDSVQPGPVHNVPYFQDQGLAATYGSGAATTALAARFFSPTRQVSSPVVLGTIPSDMATGWKTLSFSPNPAARMNTYAGGHSGPGALASAGPSAVGPAYDNLPDHLLLDLFWMPVSEPYPISEQFSTAGKVNLNYAMMPFPYIQRKTALDAVLKSVLITAYPSNNSNFLKYYKCYAFLHNQGGLDQITTRFPVNVDTTLKAFDYKFSKGDIFRSASQICDMFLYPNNATNNNQLATGVVADNPPSTGNITSWWNNNQLTGDNVRESPYNAIYSRVTTKSNTFTVHWKVQSLTKRPNSDVATWTENSDIVNSELRGSTLIERYIDPNATNIPDYATDTTGTAQPLSQFYKWRVVSENYFRP